MSRILRLLRPVLRLSRPRIPPVSPIFAQPNLNLNLSTHGRRVHSGDNLNLEVKVHKATRLSIVKQTRLEESTDKQTRTSCHINALARQCNSPSHFKKILIHQVELSAKLLHITSTALLDVATYDGSPARTFLRSTLFLLSLKNQCGQI